MVKHHKSKTNNKYFTDIPKEIPKSKRTDERLNVLLELSDLRKEQVQSGNRIGNLREELIEERKNLKTITEKLNEKLDNLEK
jgi:predicted  nucleic acid-binding Zn-ribbon protein